MTSSSIPRQRTDLPGPRLVFLIIVGACKSDISWIDLKLLVAHRSLRSFSVFFRGSAVEPRSPASFLPLRFSGCVRLRLRLSPLGFLASASWEAAPLGCSPRVPWSALPAGAPPPSVPPRWNSVCSPLLRGNPRSILRRHRVPRLAVPPAEPARRHGLLLRGCAWNPWP